MSDYSIKRTLDIKSKEHGTSIRVREENEFVEIRLVGENPLDEYAGMGIMLDEARELAKVLCELTGVYYED